MNIEYEYEYFNHKFKPACGIEIFSILFFNNNVTPAVS